MSENNSNLNEVGSDEQGVLQAERVSKPRTPEDQLEMFKLKAKYAINKTESSSSGSILEILGQKISDANRDIINLFTMVNNHTRPTPGSVSDFNKMYEPIVGICDSIEHQAEDSLADKKINDSEYRTLIEANQSLRRRLEALREKIDELKDTLPVQKINTVLTPNQSTSGVNEVMSQTSTTESPAVVDADITTVNQVIRADSDQEMYGDPNKLVKTVENQAAWKTQSEASGSAVETENAIHSDLQSFMNQLNESPHFGQFFQQEVLGDAEVNADFVNNINDTITQLLSEEDRPDDRRFDEDAVMLWMDAVEAVKDWAKKNGEATKLLGLSVQDSIQKMEKMEIYDDLGGQIAKTKVDLMAAWDRNHAIEAKVPIEKTLAAKAQEAIDKSYIEFNFDNITKTLVERGVDAPDKLLALIGVSTSIQDVITARNNLQYDIDEGENPTRTLHIFETKVKTLREVIARHGLSNSGPVESSVADTTGVRTENENKEPSNGLFTPDWVRGYDLIKPLNGDDAAANEESDQFSNDLAAALNDLLDKEIEDALGDDQYETDDTLNDDINDRIDVIAGTYKSKDGLDFSKLDNPDQGENDKKRKDFVKEAARMINEAVEEAQKNKSAANETDPANNSSENIEPELVDNSTNDKAQKGWRKILDRFKRNRQAPEEGIDQNRQYLERAKTAIENSSLWQNKKRWLLRLIAAGVGAVATHALREISPNMPLTPARIATLALGGTAGIVYLRGHESRRAEQADSQGDTRRAKWHRTLHRALDKVLTNTDLISWASFGSAGELFFHEHAATQDTSNTEVSNPSGNEQTPSDHPSASTEPTIPDSGLDVDEPPMDTTGDTEEYDGLKNRAPDGLGVTGRDMPVDTSGDMAELDDLHHPTDQVRETFNFRHQSIWDNLRETAKDIDGVQANADYPNQVINPGEVAAGQVIDPTKDAILGLNTHLTADQINNPSGMTTMTLEGVTSVEQIQQLQAEHPNTLLMPSESQQRSFMEFAAEALKADNPNAQQQLIIELNGFDDGDPLLANKLTPEQKATILNIFNGVV